ncbi:MAG: helix-turn-helix domain-containing protein, partial [Solirubrobacteraceae bacterium]
MRKEERAAAVAFGRRLRVVREQRGMSQDDLGHETKVHPTAIGRMEHGHREPRLASIERLAAGLGVHPGALMSAGESGVMVPAGIVDVMHEMVAGGHGAAIVGALREREEFERQRAECDNPEHRRL